MTHYQPIDDLCANCGRAPAEHKQFRDAKPPRCPDRTAPLTREEADDAMGEEIERHPIGGHGRPLSDAMRAALFARIEADREARNGRPRNDPATAFASALHSQLLSEDGDDESKMARIQRDIDCYQAGWAAAMVRVGEERGGHTCRDDDPTLFCEACDAEYEAEMQGAPCSDCALASPSMCGGAYCNRDAEKA